MSTAHGWRSLFAFLLVMAQTLSANEAAARRIIDDRLPPSVCSTLPVVAAQGIPLQDARVTPLTLQPALLENATPPASATLPTPEDETASWSSAYMSGGAFLACAIIIGFQRRRRLPVKVVLS